MKKTPVWLTEARELCGRSSINLVAWGPNVLTVEAKSPAKVQEVTSILGAAGFKVIVDEDDSYAGLLSLSRNPDLVRAQPASFDISHPGLAEQLQPAIWGICATGVFAWFRPSQPHPWFVLMIGVGLALMFGWEGLRIWGWRLEVLPDVLRVRRGFRWTAIPWKRIQKIESIDAGRAQESVVLHLLPHSSEKLGRFGVAFARNLRDRLRQEIAQRQG